MADASDAVAQMKQRLKTRVGRAWYALRKQTVGPVFGIIKAVMRFRQFLLRGLDAVCSEWSLVTMAWAPICYSSFPNTRTIRDVRPRSESFLYVLILDEEIGA